MLAAAGSRESDLAFVLGQDSWLTPSCLHDTGFKQACMQELKIQAGAFAVLPTLEHHQAWTVPLVMTTVWSHLRW